MSRLDPSAASAALILIGMSCASLSSYETASTLGAGKLEVAVEGALSGTTWDNSGSHSLLYASTLPWPYLGAAVRFGVIDQLDLTAKASASGLDLGFKWEPFHGSSPLHISVAPTIGGFHYLLFDAWLLDLTVPILCGLRVGAGNEVVFGPRLFGRWFQLGVISESFLGIGASLGFSFRLNDHWSLMPEFSVARVPRWLGVDSDELPGTPFSVAVSGALLQGGVALKFTP